MKTRPIRFKILLGVAFAFIVVLTTAALMIMSEHALSSMREKQVDQEFEAVASLARSRVMSEFGNADVVLDTLAVTDPYPAGTEQAARSLTLVLKNLRENSPSVFAVYAAFPDGTFILTRRITPEGLEKAKALGLGDEVAFERQTRTVENGRMLDSFAYVDRNYAVIARTPPSRAEYDARTRPWYRLASGSDVAVVTPPYRYKDYAYVGLTMSRRATDATGTIFGIDMTLDDLSTSLAGSASFPGEQVSLFSDAGQFIAGGGLSRDGTQRIEARGGRLHVASPTAMASFAAYRSNPGVKTLSFNVGSDNLIADVLPLDLGGRRFVLISSLPEDVIRDPIEKWRNASLALQAATALLALLLAMRASRWISRPILALAAEVERVVAFRFVHPTRVESDIWEMRRLAAAVRTLEVTLRAFSTYLPKSFVENIVTYQSLPELGGRNQDVVVMFSDIRGFTSISEAAAPAQLLTQLSRYFDVIEDVLSQSGGIIDKYIGDSVMAFWVVDDCSTARKACAAILQASEAVNELNRSFRSEGLPELATRFGAHFGEAMVGNVGAQHRMNYTVLGHTVNVASRIEGLNKNHGTTILVSQALRDAVSDPAAFRFVGQVTIRGVSDMIGLYEVIPNASPALTKSPAAAKDNRQQDGPTPVLIADPV